jgi:ATP phosphoribosyltransferase
MSPIAAPAARERLRIAIQKSGRLSDPARELLRAAGLDWRESRDRLFCYGETLPVDLLLVRDDDIPGLIAAGVCDLGIVGRDVLAEHGLASATQPDEVPCREWRALGFGQCRLMLAVPEDFPYRTPTDIQGLRIATSHPHLLERWLAERELAAKVVTLSGSVEIAPRLGQADLVCDLVSSGATLAAHHLRPVETILECEAVLAGPVTPLSGPRAELAELLSRRIDGVRQIRTSRLLLCQAPRSALPGVLELLPDAEPPTLTAIDGSDRLAVQALCRGALTWQRLEALKRAGATRLLVLPIEGMLA